MRFQNPPGGPKRNWNLFKWMAFFLRRLFDKAPFLPPDFVIPPGEALQQYEQFKQDDTLTWLGHSTFLIKLQNITILTDPFLTDHAAPFKSWGPKRFTPPGLSIAELPPLDIIIVSHDHFDHLDLKTLTAIPDKERIHIVVPLKMGPLFQSCGYKNIHELDWHADYLFQQISIRALPAYHYSKRDIFTRNRRLWASFAICLPNKKIYFSGDTAYGSLFLDIGRDYGPFDYALLSIGSYEPRELMSTGHLRPEEAVHIGQELRAKKLVGMHWGAIRLSDEAPFEPPERFYASAIQAGFLPDCIWLMRIGETRTI